LQRSDSRNHYEWEEIRKRIGEVREIQRDGALALYDTPIVSIRYRTGSWTLPALAEENQKGPYRLR
jgi:hypothetical protein